MHQGRWQMERHLLNQPIKRRYSSKARLGAANSNPQHWANWNLPPGWGPSKNNCCRLTGQSWLNSKMKQSLHVAPHAKISTERLMQINRYTHTELFMLHLENTTARQSGVASFSAGKRQRFNTAIPRVIIFNAKCNDSNIYISLMQSHEIKPLPSPGQTTRGKENSFVSILSCLNDQFSHQHSAFHQA